MKAILAIDQGTTSTRAIVFDSNMCPLAKAQKEFTQHFPHSGWVEHDPEEIWQTVIVTCQQALAQAGEQVDIAAIGITNQRETTLVWDKATGQAIYPAIVWQDRRTSNICQELKQQGYEQQIQNTTGLLLDPYFSGTKVQWILDHVDGARNQAEQGKLAFGTVDSYLIWRLTGGKRHVTDATNAARTLLFDIDQNIWSQDLCELLHIPVNMLPEVLDCAAEFGHTDPSLFGTSIPILGVAGDQQAATIGQACFEPGMMKSTYGTGCFALLNTGQQRVHSKKRLLSTIAYRINGQTTYALEGSIFIAGAVVQWLRDGLNIIDHANQASTLAQQADPQQELIMVPAFTGLGAPYWNPECRGAIYGLTRNSGPAELARAALESVAYQTRDLLQAMQADCPALTQQTRLRVDGGMTQSDWTMQFLADILGTTVDRPQNIESTIIGAAWLAGQQAGIYDTMLAFSQQWQMQHQFQPQLHKAKASHLYKQWQQAVQSTLAMTNKTGD
ncbi:MAG: glycerol kinase GlpK [Gammaproteobacteria bacterium]|jgi:glycerol kinase|nr:glycerol kinase GlpK [Gammaproteobacteria bacterium]